MLKLGEEGPVEQLKPVEKDGRTGLELDTLGEGASSEAKRG